MPDWWLDPVQLGATSRLESVVLVGTIVFLVVLLLAFRDRGGPAGGER